MKVIRPRAGRGRGEQDHTSLVPKDFSHQVMYYRHTRAGMVCVPLCGTMPRPLRRPELRGAW